MSHLDSEGVLEVMKKNNDKFIPTFFANYSAYLMMKHTEDHKYYLNLKMVDEYYSLLVK